MLRLRCKKCGSFLANVTSIYAPLRSIVMIEINCRNRDCKTPNEIEFRIRRPVRSKSAPKRKMRRKYN